MELPEDKLKFLEFVETTEQWDDADKHWMEILLGESLAEYDIDGPRFAALTLDYTMKIREIVQKYHPREEHANHEDCPLLFELAVLTTHMAIMATIATREIRGKPQIWQLPG